ncbi:hypothetical protein C0159_08320 [Moraxella catarrhalis]|uniref:thermonuclease family protein n=1 Tax=Moraxella catarrhalis TaxID=480 RepID=UPI00069CC033|nr:thermonuclease family protein [Moraxella catarrhalis]MPW55995.1 hypothetical protein [Moraxella catarrhalis]MPW59694.1 hypothetical protein [Moraxella catarrhalis]MPW87891.1 hypothetical protein [Moraxella catarrhalis]MPX02221.1 hypothetical protein [Moraxella catarrhalis]MPX14646.1 hypothetical protein [Moraxella catarrhalis]
MSNKQNTQVKIRFAQIDAPEKGQDFGIASKQTLSNMIYNQKVVLKVSDTDRYGRTVAEVYLTHCAYISTYNL